MLEPYNLYCSLDMRFVGAIGLIIYIVFILLFIKLIIELIRYLRRH